MTGWELFWAIVAIAIVAGIVMNLGDLMRYMKIRRM